MLVHTKVFLLVILLACVAANQTHSGSKPRRSAKWDAFRKHIRSRRDTTCTYEVKDPKNPGKVCSIANVTLYDKLGRRESGKLVEPQNQGLCGSCWAFAIANTYTDWMNVYLNPQGDTPFVSPDYLTKCVTLERDGWINGCCGALPRYGLDLIKSTGGVPSSCLMYNLFRYPPSDRELGCTFQNRNQVRRKYKMENPLTCPQQCDNGEPIVPSGMETPDLFLKVITGGEDAVIAALNKGPVVMLMYAMGLSDYLCGVYSNPLHMKMGAHAVEIVDYGTVDDCDFWVVKNSWGPGFGENGYFRIKRGDESIYRIEALTTTQSSQTASPQMTCAEEVIENPSTDIVVQAAAEVGLETLNSEGNITCGTTCGQDSANLTLTSITNATIQNVAGMWIVVGIEANVNCDATVTTANLTMTVFMDINGTFQLTTYDYVSGAGSSYFSYLVLLLCAAIACYL